MNYKERIISLLDKIDNEKFLRRIYVSLCMYVKESEVYVDDDKEETNNGREKRDICNGDY